MGQVRFQIGAPRAGSAARLAEGAEPIGRMPLPHGGSAARDAEQCKKLGEEAAGAKPIIGMRGTGGRVVSMEEMIAASRPAVAAGAAASVTRHGVPVGRPVTAAQDVVRASDNVVSTVADYAALRSTGPANPAILPEAHGSVTMAGYPLASSGDAGSRWQETSTSPGPPLFAVDRVKALVRSLFSRER